MINYIGKFLLVIFDIKKKPLCEERLRFLLGNRLLSLQGYQLLAEG